MYLIKEVAQIMRFFLFARLHFSGLPEIPRCGARSGLSDFLARNHTGRAPRHPFQVQAHPALSIPLRSPHSVSVA